MKTLTTRRLARLKDEMRRLSLGVTKGMRFPISKEVAKLLKTQRMELLKYSEALRRSRDIIARSVSAREFARLLPEILPNTVFVPPTEDEESHEDRALVKRIGAAETLACFDHYPLP